MATNKDLVNARYGALLMDSSSISNAMDRALEQMREENLSQSSGSEESSGNNWQRFSADGFQQLLESLRANGERITNQFVRDGLITIESIDRSGRTIQRKYELNLGAYRLMNEHFSDPAAEEHAAFSGSFIHMSSTVMPIESAISSRFHHEYMSPVRDRTPTRPVDTFTLEAKGKDDEFREYVDGDGLFQRGIKKFKALPWEDQVKEINKLKFVKNFDGQSKKATIDISKFAGKYEIIISANPQAWRLHFPNRRSHLNPFISTGDHTICLGNMRETYNKCWNNKNYLECLKVIKSVLGTRKDSHGYRRWTDCN